MMLESDIRYLGTELVGILYYLIAVYGMQLHCMEFLIGQPVRFLEDLDGDLAFADVVQDRSHAERHKRFFPVTQFFADYDGIDAYVHRVQERIVVDVPYPGKMQHYGLVFHYLVQYVVDRIPD